jgi:DNA (cytosine-5)-methyltransferase 1
MPISGTGWISHHPECAPVRHFIFGDLRQLNGQDILSMIGVDRVDLVFGGPPCQGFSRANNKRKAIDPRNTLVFTFARLVLDIMPDCMVMENVPGIVDMVTPEGVPVLDAFCQILSSGGFGTYDALRKSLLQSAGLGAAVRGSKKEKKASQPKPETQQLTLALNDAAFTE